MLHDKVPVPIAAGVRRLKQDHRRGGGIKRGRVGPLQQKLATRVARRVIREVRRPINGADEHWVASAVCPCIDYLPFHVVGMLTPIFNVEFERSQIARVMPITTVDTHYCMRRAVWDPLLAQVRRAIIGLDGDIRVAPCH